MFNIQKTNKMKTKVLFLSLLFFLSFSANLKAQNSIPVCDNAETYYELNEALADIENVIKLDIAMQKLRSIPASIGKLKNLVCLDLSFNRISTLPVEFANLKNLKYLNLAGTRYMPNLPEVLKQLPNLEVLDLRDHPEWTASKNQAAVKALPNVKVLID